VARSSKWNGPRAARGPARERLRPRASWSFFATVAALVCCFLTGCTDGGTHSITLKSWQLVFENGASRTIELPVHLDRELAARPQTYRLRTEVVLPASWRGRPVALVVPHLLARVELRVAGQEVPPDRRPWFSTYRTAGPHGFWLTPEQTSSQLELELEVRHEWTQSGWLDVAPYLTSAPGGGARYAGTRALVEFGNVFGAGSIFLLWVTYAILFLHDRRRRAHGWLAVQAAFAIPYLLFGAGVTQVVFGPLDVPISTCALGIAVVASVRFTHAQFGLATPGPVWSVVALVALGIAVVMRGPFAATRGAGTAACLIIVVGVVYQLCVVGRLALGGDASSSARRVLAAWLLLASFSVCDIVAWLGLGELLGGARTACLGITSFGILQSAVLGGEFIASLRRSELLNGELGQRLGELAEQQASVSHLNGELRRQIRARSEQLSDALSRLANAQGAPVVLHEGDLVEERYRIVRPIGAGGMGVVYEVERSDDNVRFALKLISGFTGMRELARFAREGKLAATVDHPNVVKIFDASVSKTGLLFLVLELVDGEPLNRCRARYGDVPWALRVLTGIAQGLAAIHAEGIVHRDLKPANVLVSHDGEGHPREIKITDFGISNSATASSDSRERESPTPVAAPPAGPSGSTESDPETSAWASAETVKPNALLDEASPATGSLTQTGALLGTPAYMAPEALRGARTLHTAADVYSLAIIAFELLEGRRLAEHEAPARAFGRYDAHAPSGAGAAMHASLADLLGAALALDPERRPTAAEIAAALRRHAS